MADSLPVKTYVMDDWSEPKSEMVGEVRGRPIMAPGGQRVAPVIYRSSDSREAAEHARELAAEHAAYVASRCINCRNFDRDKATAELLKDTVKTALIAELGFSSQHFDTATLGYCAVNSTRDAPLFTTPDASCDNHTPLATLTNLSRR